MNVSFEFAALHYLNRWLIEERLVCEGIAAADAETRLEALARGAKFFRIARTLPKKYDCNRRFGPVLEIIDSLAAAEFAEDRTSKILDIHDQISAKYGGRNVLSPTTKFLWIKIRSPIIIYDSRARDALKVREREGLLKYYEAWQNKYNQCESAISAACLSLVEVLPYTANTSLATESYVRDLANSRWFRERVFDIYLWHIGNKG